MHYGEKLEFKAFAVGGGGNAVIFFEVAVKRAERFISAFFGAFNYRKITVLKKIAGRV